MKLIFSVLTAVVTSYLFCSLAWSWDNERTHKDLSEISSNKSILGTTKYLINIGLDKGLLHPLNTSKKNQTIYRWLQEGADLEDAGNPVQAVMGQARFNNHFHNPLKPWDQAGLDDVIAKVVPNPLPPFIPPLIYVSYHMTGESAITWAQNSEKQDKALEGNWTWSKTRDFYYYALTLKTDADRQAYFAQTFRGLGHQMHLLQDMAVPAHVRNDGHPEESIQDMFLKKKLPGGDLYFEMWAKKYPGIINAFASKPSFPVVDLSKKAEGLSPITQFYDTDQYVKEGSPDTGLTWGLSEYTNANFVSADTIFTETFDKNDRHYFPYPSYAPNCYQIVETVDAATNKKKRYLKKTCQGELVTHFAAAGPLFPYLWPLHRGSLKLDETTHRDYTEKLLPRAVGYSAALLDYFFRGDINLIYDATSSLPGYRIVNSNPEEMSGMFEIYYDNSSNERVLLVKKYLYLAAAQGSPVQSEIIEFNLPANAKEAGKYIVVFRGKMGNENDAVAGRVTGSGLEVTPPERYAYGVTDGSSLPQQFTEIEAKVRNMAADGKEIKAGTLWAVAKYKIRTDYQPDMSTDTKSSPWSVAADFSYSSSAPIAITSLSSKLPMQFTFDFSAEPIPAGITDLYLQVIFEGSLGDIPGISTAMAVKDILEPTHHVLWNLTDEVSLMGHLYTAEQILADPELLALVGKDLPLIYPRPASYAVGFSGQCPPKDFTSVSAAVNDLPAGRFIRVISLFDRQDGNCLNVQWWDSASPNTWSASFRFNAAKSQTENGVFNPAYVIPFRSILQHFFQGVLYCSPVFNGKFCAYPETEAIEPPTQIPYPLTSILP